MNNQPLRASFPTPKTPAQAILTAWLIAGTLDLTTAVINSGAPLEKVLRFVASGAFGQAAFTGGWPMLVWGLAFHFFIALCWTLLFYWLYPQVKPGSKNLVLTGLGYGVVVWLVMNLLVVPLTLTSKRPFDWFWAGKGMLVLMLMIGLPIALIIGRYYRNLRST